MHYLWLKDEDNRDFLYHVCEQLVERHAPEEMPIFEEVYPQFVAVAQNDNVTIGSDEEDAFGFAGEGDLFVLTCLPAVSMLLGAFLAYRSARRFREIQDASRDELAQFLSRAEQNDTDIADFSSDVGNDPLLDVIYNFLTQFRR